MSNQPLVIYLRFIYILAFLVLTGCESKQTLTLTGFVEAEYVRVATNTSGKLLTIHVKRGDRVTQNQLLFEIDPENEKAQIDAIQAQLAYSQAEYLRQTELINLHFTSHSNLELLQAQKKQQTAQLAQATWMLNQKTGISPTDARVEDIYYREGEWAAAGKAIVSLLPANNIKARFFVPEIYLSKLYLNQIVYLHCDGCTQSIPATIRFIASEAEFTPPVIYSTENRSRLVYLVEAFPSPEQASKLRPGQPLEVTLDFTKKVLKN